MKGLQEKAASNLKFVRIRGGNLCEVSKEPQPGWESFEDKNGNIRYMKTYSRLEAMVTGIQHDPGNEQFPYPSWEIHWDSGDLKGRLSLSCNSSQGSRFTKLVENIDLTEPAEFRIWSHPVDGKMKHTLIVSQHDKSIPQKYTAENPGEMPPAKVLMGGKKSFDDQEQFLYERTMAVSAKLAEMYPPNAPAVVAEVDDDGPDAPEDEIPF